MKGFALKTDYTDLIDLLSDDDAGLLLRAIMHYARDGFVEADMALRSCFRSYARI